MGIKNYIIDFKELGYKDSLRLWIPFVLIKSKYKYDKIIKFLSTCESGSRPKGGIKGEDSGGAISLGGEQIGKNGNLDLSKVPYVSLDFYNKSKKGRVKDEDILLCKDGALTGKTCFVDSSIFPIDKVMVNEHVYILRGNSEINQKFLFYYTTTNIFQSQIKDLAYKKKAQPGLNTSHLKKIKIPLITKSKQDQIISEIEPIEKKIKDLKLQIIPSQKIINKIFTRVFGFDENLVNDFGKGMTVGTQISKNSTLRIFETNLEELSRSRILRFSTRFHNPPTKNLMGFLESMDTLEVKDVVRDYEKGVQPRYNPNGEIPVVKIANLKNGHIDFNESEFITKEHYQDLDERKKLKKDDIIICATGKGSLGKIDVYESEQESITTVDNYILRLKDNYIPLFFTYFFRSIFGYFQMERDYTGATNQIHLYWEHISNFKIPDISLSKQQEIVDEIKAVLENHKEIKKEIISMRKRINTIIEDNLK